MNQRIIKSHRCSKRLIRVVSALLMTVWVTNGGTMAQQAMPDNVLNTNCMYFAESHAWSIVEDWHTAEEYCARIIPLVGDVDGDGVPEIILFKSNGYYNTNEMYVVDSRTHQRVHTISLPRQIKVDHAAPYGLVKLPATAASGLAGHVIIVIATDGNYLYAFDLTARGTSPIWSASGTGFPAPTVAFSDFNCDGHPEVYIANKIYDAETGALLVTAPGSNAGKAHGHANATNVIATFAADITEDGKPDLLLGNEVYSIAITNRNGTAGNSATLAARCTPPSGLPNDGHTQVADFNYDGHLDILITCKTASRGDASCYVWDVYNNTVSTPVVESQCYEGMAVPLIADIDNNGTVEIVWQTAYCYGGRNNNPGNNMRAYKYDPSTRSFSEMWQLRIHDDSYSVPATLFDLNNDGYNDIIITDDDGIKIVNGSGKSHLTGHDTLAVYTESSFSIRANTTMQYAVVADIDGSGSAKILVLGKSGSYNGYLYAFRSVDDPWMPARKVWNQYIYNATCVNEDLTIPQHPYNNAMALTDPQTNEVRRPYNNCLQQSTAIDIYGRKVTITADVNNTNVTSTVVGDSVELTITYCNNGAADLNAPYPVVLRKNAINGPAFDTIYPTAMLPRGGCTTLTKRIATEKVTAEGIVEVFVVPNGTAAGVAQQVAGLQMECNMDNNSASVLLMPVVYGTADSTVCDDVLPLTWNGVVFTEGGNQQTHLTAAGGEDSLLTMNLHVNYRTASDTTAVECDHFSWWGESYSSTPATDPVRTLTNAAGCDSTVTLHLTITHSTTGDTTAVECDHFTWWGNDYTSTPATDPTHVYSNAGGCDSTVTLHLTITHSNTGDTTAVECDHFAWWGDSYASTPATDPTHVYTNSAGCDSTVTLHLTIHHSTTGDTVAVECDQFGWWGDSYTSTPDSDPTHVYTNEAGCDSTVTLHLTIHYSNAGDTTAVECDHFAWWGNTYTSTPDSDPTHIYTNHSGCDSTVTLHLTVHHSNTGDTTATACDSFRWWDTDFTSSTESATRTFGNGENCDSVVTLHLTIRYSNTGDTVATACDSFRWWDTDFTASANDATRTFTNAAGCDSTVTLHLTVNYQSESTVWDTIVENQLPYLFNGTTFNGPTTATDLVIANATGCDSTIHYNLHVYYNYAMAVDSTVCDNRLPIVWNALTFTASDTRTTTLTAMHGEDSVVTMTLTVNPTYTTTEYDTICDNETFTFHGSVYTQDGSYTHTLASREGCDSTATAVLKVHRTYRVSSRADVCANASYEWGTPRRAVWEAMQADQPGASQQRTVTQTDNLFTIDHCDSISTLNLTVHGVYLHSERDTFCFGEQYRWHWWEGNLNSEHNNIEKSIDLRDTLTTAVHGCDSIFFMRLTQRPHPVITINTEPGCEYKMRIGVDVPYHVVSATPADSTLIGQEHGTYFELNPGESTLYTVYADFRETPTCPYTESQRLAHIVPPQALIKVSPEVLASNRLEYDLYDSGEMRDHRRWFINGEEQSDSAWHIKRNANIEDDSIVITLMVTRYDCGDTATRVLYIRHDAIFAPNAFTPEQELNNRFAVVGGDVMKGELSIYNRGGMLVYRTEDFANGWDGAGAPQGTYVWVFKYSIKGIEDTPKVASGMVVLIR